MIARFWWGNGENDRKMHWISWKKMAQVKSKRGLGFRDFEKFNDAVWAKLLWRLITHPNLLVSRVIKAIYLGRAKELDRDTLSTALS